MSDSRQATEIPLPMEPHESWLSLDDQSIGLHFWAWFTEFVFDKAEIDLGDECRQKSVEQILADHDALLRDLPRIALDLDQNDVEGAILEKAAKFCVRCELIDAGVLIREFIERRIELSRAVDEATTGRQWRKRIAQQPRRDGLSQLIWERVQNTSGKITESELRTEIEVSLGCGVIDEVTEDKIYFINRDGTGGHSSPISALRGRLSRAKKKYRELSAR